MKPIVLTILDGFGISEIKEGNAIALANKPNYDYMFKKYPHTELEASGAAVGLPDNQMGNSEVGHLNIGAGRIVYQPLELINQAIKDKTFFQNSVLLDAVNHAKNNNSNIHILGLLSDGGVHSHIDHFKAVIDMVANYNQKAYCHFFTDGRDTSPTSGISFIKDIESYINNKNNIYMASIIGRYYAMDRDNRWERINKAYDLLVNGIGTFTNNPEETIQNFYNQNITDEFLEPIIINDQGLIKENDTIIWVNFRPDRSKEILTTLLDKEFNKFPTIKFENLKIVTMLPAVKTPFAFELEPLENTLGTYLSEAGLKQLRIAETEKYAHVTYFLDGGKELVIPNCDRILVASPKVATYDLEPAMSAYKVTDKLIAALDNNYDVVILNFANPDMVGHTGDIEATIKAIETIDQCLGKIYQKVKELDGTLIITADHGNAETLIDPLTKEVVTNHTCNKVPLIICQEDYLLDSGKLADIAPTILKLLNIEKPKEMIGKSLII